MTSQERSGIEKALQGCVKKHCAWRKERFNHAYCEAFRDIWRTCDYMGKPTERKLWTRIVKEHEATWKNNQKRR